MQLLDALKHKGHLARYGAFRAWEVLAKPRPNSPRKVPPRAEDITPGWLTEVLCKNVPGALIEKVIVVGGSDGTTNRRALDVVYNDQGKGAGLPERLFTKGTGGLRERLFRGPSGSIQSEIEFYRDIQPFLDVEAPQALYAGYEHLSGRSLVIFRDIVRDGGVRFLDPTCHVTREMAEGMVGLMAAYHAAMWNSPKVSANGAWRKNVLQYQLALNATIPFLRMHERGFDRSSNVLPDELKRRRGELWAAHMKSLFHGIEGPCTLIHWDMHIGNWYQCPGKTMGLSDWSLRTGKWACDYTYAIVSALTVEDRREWERDLLKLYLEKLSAHGLTNPPSFDEAWLDYRRQSFHPLFYWTATIGATAMHPNLQPDEISLLNIHRMSQAIIDMDATSALRD